MSRVPVFQLMFLLVQLSEFANTQQGVSSPDTTTLSVTGVQQQPTSTNAGNELTVECVRELKCIYKLRQGVSSLFESNLNVHGLQAPPCQNECSTDRTPCLCCEQNAEKTRDVLQDYDDAYKYQQLKLRLQQAGQTNNYTEALRKLQAIRTQLLRMCATLYCDLGTRECKYITCTCERTTLPSETTTRAAVNTDRTSTPSTRPTSVHTTMSTTTSATGLTDGDSPNVTAIALGVVVAVLVAAGVAVFIVWWLRWKGAKHGGGEHHTTIAFVAETHTDDSPYSELSDGGAQNQSFTSIFPGSSTSGQRHTNVNEQAYSDANTMADSGPTNTTFIATRESGYLEPFGFSKPSRTEDQSSNDYYSPLNPSDRMGDRSDPQNEYAPLRFEQSTEAANTVREISGNYTALSYPDKTVGREHDRGAEKLPSGDAASPQDPNNYLTPV